MSTPSSHYSFSSPQAGCLELRLQGLWTRNARLAGEGPPQRKPAQREDPAADPFYLLREAIRQQLKNQSVTSLSFDTKQLTGWDSRLLALLLQLDQQARSQQHQLVLDGLPLGLINMLKLAEAVPPKQTRKEVAKAGDLFSVLGRHTKALAGRYGRVSDFIGTLVLSLGRFMRGKAVYNRTDMVGFFRQAGPEALGIVFVINLMMGMILAFMGAIQLSQFGAQIYVADMVAIGLTRELAPMMTAVIMTGRTGAAYAAQLGSMVVNQEVDALKSFGFSPIDFLVTPRLIALIIMVPLLVIYADVVGMLGGWLVGVSLLDLSSAEYLGQTQKAIGLGDIFYGLIKSSVYGVLVAVTGCLYGINSGRTASAVGQATTGAVVSGIVCIVIATACFAVIANVLGI